MRAGENCVADLLCLECIAKRGCHRLTFGQPLEKVGYLMDKAVFIPDLDSWRPPFIHIRVIPAIRDVNGPPAANPPFVAVIEVLKAMQVMQIPFDRSVFTVDLESIQSLMTARVASRLE